MPHRFDLVDDVIDNPAVEGAKPWLNIANIRDGDIGTFARITGVGLETLSFRVFSDQALVNTAASRIWRGMRITAELVDISDCTTCALQIDVESPPVIAGQVIIDFAVPAKKTIVLPFESFSGPTGFVSTQSKVKIGLFLNAGAIVTARVFEVEFLVEDSFDGSIIAG